METGAKTKPKAHRKVMTLAEKVELLNILKQLKSFSAVAKLYGINESTVRCIYKNEKNIRISYATLAPGSARTVSQVREKAMIKMERALNIWMVHNQRKGSPVNSAILREKAKDLYDHYREQQNEKGSSNAGRNSFVASRGWLDRFKKRFSLRKLRPIDETAPNDHEAARAYEESNRDLTQEALDELVRSASEEEPDDDKMPERRCVRRPKSKRSEEAMSDLFRHFQAFKAKIARADSFTKKSADVIRRMEEAFEPYHAVFGKTSDKIKQEPLEIVDVAWSPKSDTRNCSKKSSSVKSPASEQDEPFRTPLKFGQERGDEFDAFGVMVASKLRKMEETQRLHAENIINQALYKGLTFQLSPRSDADFFNSKLQTNNGEQAQHQQQQQHQHQDGLYFSAPTTTYDADDPLENQVEMTEDYKQIAIMCKKQPED